jgi:hypothetical protein
MRSQARLECTYLIFLFKYCSAVSLILTSTIDESSSADWDDINAREMKDYRL